MSPRTTEPAGMVVTDLGAYESEPRRCTRCGEASAAGNRVGTRSGLCRRCMELVPAKAWMREKRRREGGARAAQP